MALTYTNEQTQHRLDSLRRRSAAMSLFIVLLVCAVVAVLFSLWVIEALSDNNQAVITPLPKPAAKEKVIITEEIITPEVTENSVAAPPTPKMIRVSTPQAISVPQTDISAEMAFGEVANATGVSGLGLDGFGDGLGVGNGSFTLMGYTSGEGKLQGQLYDLKIDQSRRPTNFAPRDFPTYTTPVREIAEMVIRGEDPKTYKNARPVGTGLFLNTMMVPNQTANASPEAFGAGDKMDPKGWMAHYQGEITAPKRGKFRFIGRADDMMLILIDKKLVLDASHSSIKNNMLDTSHLREERQAIGWAGEWIKVNRGDTLDMDFFVGENPGGRMEFQLIVEWEGEELERSSEGRNLYEIFAMKPLEEEEIEHIEKGFGKDQYKLKGISYFGK